MPAQCSVFVATTVDGFIARPDAPIEWRSLVEPPGEDYGYEAFFHSIDALVVGRKTYEAALGFERWPYAGKRCVVLTDEARGSSKHGEEFSSNTPKQIVARLTSGGTKRIFVDGGEVIQAFLAARLVNDLTVSIVPTSLGEGVPLFGTTGSKVQLDLVGSRAFKSGVVQVEYRIRKATRARRARPATKPKTTPHAETAEHANTRTEDRIGFLLALPDDPTAVEINRLASEFGIKGPVDVTTYTGADVDGIGMSLIAGQGGPWSVTRYPRDMNAFFDRLAEQWAERLGLSLLLEASTKRG